MTTMTKAIKPILVAELLHMQSQGLLTGLTNDKAAALLNGRLKPNVLDWFITTGQVSTLRQDFGELNWLTFKEVQKAKHDEKANSDPQHTVEAGSILEPSLFDVDPRLTKTGSIEEPHAARLALSTSKISLSGSKATPWQPG